MLSQSGTAARAHIICQLWESRHAIGNLYKSLGNTRGISVWLRGRGLVAIADMIDATGLTTDDHAAIIMAIPTMGERPDLSRSYIRDCVNGFCWGWPYEGTFANALRHNGGDVCYGSED